MKTPLFILTVALTLLCASCKTVPHDFEANLGKKAFGKSDPVPYGFRSYWEN